MISIVHSAPGFDNAKESLVDCRPNLLIVEYGLCAGSANNSRTSRAMPFDLKTIVVGVPDMEEDILACIERDGAAAYLLMESSLSDLIGTIQAVMNGETVCSPRIASLAFQRMAMLARQISVVQPQSCNGPSLTRRESEVCRLIDDGLSNKEIAVRLHIEVSTVKNHIHNILDKLNVSNRYAAAKHISQQAIPINSSNSHSF
jgi:DNA-binding NarL/FixJ family response regulator